jgi:hypothetical protein
MAESVAEGDKIVVLNVNTPGRSGHVDRRKYDAMHAALVRVLPTSAPGLTQAEMIGAVVAHLPNDLFPGGATAGWWVKTVQLDQEARGTIVREPVKPLRWHRIAAG